MYFALRAALTHRQPMTAIADVLNSDQLYPHPERLVTFIGNHDTTRFMSQPGATLPALHLAFGLLATLRGMPQLYYGDELAMTGGEDPDNRKDFPGGFANDHTNAFTGASETDAEQSTHTWIQTLLQLRHSTSELQTGQQQTILANTNTIAYVRALDVTTNCTTAPSSVRYLIFINNDTKPQNSTIQTNTSTLSGCAHYTSVLKSDATALQSASGLQVHIGPQEIGIFKAQP
jgi:glycosidase